MPGYDHCVSSHRQHPGKRTIRPFRIEVPDAVLKDLHRRLADTRWPDQLLDDWRYGTPLAYLQDLCRYWQDTYDWRAWERYLNSFPQFLLQYEDGHVHYIHRRSPHPGAVPLLITHGWPGSFVEFHKVIEPLADPAVHGGRPEDAFHIVCPSIPGFGFSTAPTQPGVGSHVVSELFIHLMADLGYHRFFVQGGDLGAGISLRIGRIAQKRIRGIHLNMALFFEPADDPMRGVSPEEQMEIDDRNDPDDLAYGRIQSARPQSLGYGMNDSPAALAAWIVEKFHSWTDHQGDHETAVSRDEILTNICIYWFTGTITSSFRYYYENAHLDESVLRLPSQVPAPLSVALFPKDLLHPPRAWAERQFNLVRWTRMPRGGHFAALEEPELLVADIREAFRPQR